MTEKDPPNEALGSSSEPWRLRRAEVVGIIAFWTFAALLTAANRLLDPRFPGQQMFASSVPLAIAFFESYLWALLTPLIFWLTWRVNLERPGRARRIVGLITVGIVIAILVDTAGAAFRTHILDFPFRRTAGVSPVQSISRLWFVNDLITFVGVMAAGFARDFFVRNRQRQQETDRLQAQTAQLQAQLAEARLEALRMQINPHFLFNTLHAVTALVERDPRGVRRMIARLSELLRYTLNQTAEQEVTVEEEMDFLGIPGLLEPDQVRALLHQRQNDRRRPVAAGDPVVEQVSTFEQLALLRRELNGLVAAWNHRTGQPHGVTHAELRRACGGPPAAVASADQLRDRIDRLREWAARRTG